MDSLSLFDSQDLVNIGIGFVVACPLESYKNSKEMRGSVSPLRVTLILTVPHLQLKRAGIRSLSSSTDNTSTYIPASSTVLILLWCLRFSRYIYTMICVVALCRTSSGPLLKLKTTMTYKIGTKALSAILDAMKLIRSPPIDSFQNMILMTILTSESQRKMACPVHPSRCLF